MGEPDDFDCMGEWEAYEQPWSWPRLPGRLFIVDATARALDASFGPDWKNRAFDPEIGGYRHLMAREIPDLLTSGSLLATAHRLDGSAALPVAPEEWSRTSAYLTVSTGIMSRRHGRRSAVPHQVFVGEREADILVTLYRATTMQHEREDSCSVALLGDVVRQALSATARNPAAVAKDEAATLRMLLPRSSFSPHPDDKDVVIAAAVVWLLRAFVRDRGNAMDMSDFEAAAIEAFSPIMTGRLFEEVWSATRATVAPKTRNPRHPEHVHRFTSGPNKKAA